MADEEEIYNIYLFPRERQSKVPMTVEEVQEAVTNIAVYHVDETIGPIMGILTETIEAAGFDVVGNEEHCIKDVALLFTSLRSMLLKMRGVSHSFQDLAEEQFDEDDGVVTLKNGDPVVPQNRYYEESE